MKTRDHLAGIRKKMENPDYVVKVSQEIRDVTDEKVII